MGEGQAASNVESRAHFAFLRFLEARERQPGLSLEGWLASPEARSVEAQIAGDLRELERVRANLGRALSPTPADAGGAREGSSPSASARVGDFVLEERLGAGAMGEVWRARQVSLARDVALKFMRRGTSDEQRRAFFAREARAGARLAHAGIVAVHGSGEDGDLAWIAMELVPGGRTLADRLRALRAERDLPPSHHEDAALFALDLARALHAAHEHDVVHRDLKPGNILLDPAGRPKVSDFGLAKLLDELSLSREGEVAGTYAYMSPEQVQGKSTPIDHRTDVFSFGVVFYELLTLARPFEGDTAEQIKLKICLHPPADPRALRSRVPSDLATIALKCLEKSPGRRYRSMREVADDLERFLRHEPIHARAPGRARRVELWMRRNPTLSAVCGVVAVALVVVMCLLVLSVRRERRYRELADLRAVRALVAEADDLWPVDPARISALESWLARADALARDLGRHRTALEELRARARPRTEDDIRRERESHPDRARLLALRAELESKRRAETARGSRREVPDQELPDPRAAAYDDIADPVVLYGIAVQLVRPERTQFGQETIGLTLARRALPLVPEGERAAVHMTTAWALFSLGRDDQAEKEVARALTEPLDERAEVTEKFAEALTAALTRARSPDGRAEAAQRIAELESQIGELETRTSARTKFDFDDPDEAFLHEGVSALVGEMEAFVDPLRGLFDGLSPEHGPGVRRRLERARTIAARSLEDPRWRAAIATIADTRKSPQYGGLEIAPQLGLVPLGADQGSGLWEFLALESGSEPERDERGQIVPSPEMGVVFVLVPGATATIGVQTSNAAATRYEPDARWSEEPVRRVELDPYFISKYELTQAQWQRATGTNPSYFPAGAASGPNVTSLVHPVERVSWIECERVMRREGWCLPTEAQWEHAARAGTEGRWWTGDDVQSLQGAANLCDATFMRSGLAAESYEEEIDDGWISHAPVGSFHANAFGLHDVCGNVFEWCRDGWEELWRPRRRGDGLGLAPDLNMRMLRGGAFRNRASDARSSYRMVATPGANDWVMGVRPARVLQS